MIDKHGARINWPGETIRYRVQTGLRVLTGFIGGYVLTGYITAITALILPMSRADAAMLSGMLSYIWFAGILIWVFATKSLRKLGLIMMMLIGALAMLYEALHSGMAG